MVLKALFIQNYQNLPYETFFCIFLLLLSRVLSTLLYLGSLFLIFDVDKVKCMLIYPTLLSISVSVFEFSPCITACIFSEITRLKIDRSPLSDGVFKIHDVESP